MALDLKMDHPLAAGGTLTLLQPLFTTKAEGIGLGLVVCRNLTEANGGTIDVTSEPGTQTVFTVIMPVENSQR